MSALVRPATLDDVEAVAASEQANLDLDAWSPSLVAQGVLGELPTIHYLVAESEGVVVGHAVASLVGDLGELQRIAVAAPHRRTGVASALLDAVLALAAGEDTERVLLEVRETNEPALAFYARHGFMEIDRRPRYYNDGETAVVMQRTVS